MAQQRYTRKEVIEALRAAHGIMAVAARRMGCNRRTIVNYAKRYASVQAVIDEERAGIVDVAEDRLFRKVNQGEDWAVKWVLATLGKDRGYTERQELSGAAGGAIIFEIGRDDNADNNDKG